MERRFLRALAPFAAVTSVLTAVGAAGLGAWLLFDGESALKLLAAVAGGAMLSAAAICLLMALIRS